MPPKSKSLEDLVSNLSDKLDEISTQLKEVRDLQEEHDRKFDRLETLLSEAKLKFSELKKENSKLKQELSDFKERVNNLEQRNCANCIRVFDLPISGDASDNTNVQAQLYTKLLLPILKGAKDKGQINNIPSPDDTIEVAHILPGQKTHKLILCRFKNPRIKQVIMRAKKDFAPRSHSRGDKPGPYSFPFYDDVTRDNYTFMKKLGADVRVLACWYAAGAIKYRLKDSDTVLRVHSIYSDIEDLFN